MLTAGLSCSAATPVEEPLAVEACKLFGSAHPAASWCQSGDHLLQLNVHSVLLCHGHGRAEDDGHSVTMKINVWKLLGSIIRNKGTDLCSPGGVVGSGSCVLTADGI